MFLLAMERMQSNEITDDCWQGAANKTLRENNFSARLDRDWYSYFHIAGLHGIPTADWNNIGSDLYYRILEQEYVYDSNEKVPLTVLAEGI